MIGRRSLALVGLLLAILLITQNAFANSSLKSPKRAAGTANPIELVSVGSSGYGGGTYASLSASGRYIAFESSAADLAPGEISDSWDAYLRDQQTGQFERVSTGTGGVTVYNPGDYTSAPVVSADGQLVAFLSRAENVVTNDGNNMPDIFLHNRLAGTTELVSVALNGHSGDDGSFTPAISAGGRYVVFQSFASNLVAGDTNNGLDVFIRDRQQGVTELVSITNEGLQGSDPHDYGFPGVTVSDDGRYVAYAYQSLPVTGSPNAGPNVYLRDRQAQTTRWIASGTLPTLSGDGRLLAFASFDALLPDDTNGGQDVYVLDLSNGQYERISVAGSGSETADFSVLCQPSLSADGRFVAFETTAGLVQNDTNAIADIYLRDRQLKSTTLVTASADGSPGNGESHFPAISADGSKIAFDLPASNLVAGDANNQNDVFLYHRPALASVLGEVVYIPLVATK